MQPRRKILSKPRLPRARARSPTPIMTPSSSSNTPSTLQEWRTSAGSRTWRSQDAAARGELFSFMDATNVDLKAFTEEFYKRLCTGHLGAVLETLEYLKQTKVWFEITTLLIPGHNDSPDE